MTELSSTDKLGAVHHYVPQGYLRRFAIAKNPEQIVAYETGKNPYITNIHNIAGQRDFYTFTINETGEKDSTLEDALADVDAEGVNMFRLLDSKPDGIVDDLTDEQRGDLLSYIAFQHTRNLQERKMWATSYEQQTRMMMQAVASREDSYHRDAKKTFGDKYDREAVEKTREAFLAGDAAITFDPMDQYFMGVALNMSRTLYEILFTQKKLILVSRTPDAGVFITSDNPVTHYLTEEQLKKRPWFMGVGYLDAIFQIPISPDRCLQLINHDMIMETFQYNANDVNYINFQTYHFADRWVFSNTNHDNITESFAKFKRTTPLTSISSPFDTSRKI